MGRNRVGLLLIVTVFVMAVTPLTAAFYLFQDALRTSLNLGFNPQVVRTLENSSENLRTLGRLDEANRASYRAQFEEVEELKQVYSEPELIKQRLSGSLRLYFGLGLGVVVLLSLAVATLLSRRIARSHALNIAELNRERDKVRYLQEMSSWQELARMLAHEIKNPLTPIEVLVSSLSKSYLSKDRPTFLAQLTETQSMIGEEIRQLKSTVNRFSEFARMPQVALADVELVGLLDQQLKALAHHFPAVDFDLHLEPGSTDTVRLDATLFRQVLMNLVRNGVEANPQRRVRFMVSLEVTAEWFELRIGNDGAAVPIAIANRLFDPYITTKSGKDNMGLGLAIAKKIVLEHGGDIRHEERDGHPMFFIRLPRIKP